MLRKKNRMAAALITLATIAFSGLPTMAQTATETEVTVEKIAAKAIDYLKTSGAQNPEDGSFSFPGPAVTALVTTGMLKHGVEVTDPTVAKGLEYITGFADKADGGIYKEDSQFKNYETCLSILCLVEANIDGRYDSIIKNAVTYTMGTQWAEGREIQESDDRYGGFGYGKHERPDLSNTSYAVDAMVAGGVAKDSPEMQRTLKFLEGSQNLYSDRNKREIAEEDKGGFIYTPSGGGESKAESSSVPGGLRSYGSMTYAGLKSMLYAGLEKDDVRIKAAMDWIRMNYDLQKNPGMGDEGLFYYYLVFAKALDAMGEDIVLDDNGKEHDWRNELLTELASRQAKDGSFTNTGSDRWMESDATLVTAYVLLALEYCKKDEK